jgi:predicted acyl esterase
MTAGRIRRSWRGASEGTFDPFVAEEVDGFDSVAWVADQEWCTGQVVMAGASYLGATQWLAAASAPPSLRGIAPVISSDDFAEGWSYTAGVPEYGFLTSWSAAELVPEADRMLDDPSRSWEDVGAAQAVAPWLHDWLANGPDPAYWRIRSVAHRRAEMKVPALVVGGWFDIFLAASLRSFARSTDSRDRLILGPWSHSDTLSHLVGAGNVGFAGEGSRTFPGWLLDFYDAVLVGREPGLPRVRAYALGARRWVDLESWPPPGARSQLLLVDAGEFAVDPAAPVPALGGRGLLIQAPGGGCGIADQRLLLGRGDVLAVRLAPLDSDTVLAGPMAADLATSVDGADPADRLWAVTLCVQQPDGALHNLAEGIARSQRHADRVQVELGDTFAWLPAGTTITLLIAGSSYPRWPRPAAAGRQQVLAGSRLHLTVAPGLAANLSALRAAGTAC